jgi:molybdenum cofactor cytidylyltransferase
MPSGPVVGILLAAGSGSRFGGDKLLAKLDDGTAVGEATLRSLARVLDRVVAVVRPGDAPLLELLQAGGADVAICERAAEGMGASLACGVARASQRWSDATGWLVVLADMPWLAPASIAAVAAALVRGSALAAPAYAGRRGHPVGISSRFRDDLLALSGDEGARGLLAAHRGEVELIATSDPSVLRDVDTPDDLRR